MLSICSAKLSCFSINYSFHLYLHWKYLYCSQSKICLFISYFNWHCNTLMVFILITFIYLILCVCGTCREMSLGQLYNTWVTEIEINLSILVVNTFIHWAISSPWLYYNILLPAIMFPNYNAKNKVLKILSSVNAKLYIYIFFLYFSGFYLFLCKGPLVLRISIHMKLYIYSTYIYIYYEH